jgi:hypothetical protein
MATDPGVEPDILLGPLKVWIAGRQFPQHADYWDGNWLTVEARCSSPDSSARIGGAIVHLSDIQHWISELRRLSETVEGQASLECTEPEIAETVRLDKLGSGVLVVALRRCEMESHEWTVQVDQSYLPGWIASLEAVLAKYPIRGKP